MDIVVRQVSKIKTNSDSQRLNYIATGEILPRQGPSKWPCRTLWIVCAADRTKSLQFRNTRDRCLAAAVYWYTVTMINQFHLCLLLERATVGDKTPNDAIKQSVQQQHRHVQYAIVTLI